MLVEPFARTLSTTGQEPLFVYLDSLQFHEFPSLTFLLNLAALYRCSQALLVSRSRVSERMSSPASTVGSRPMPLSSRSIKTLPSSGNASSKDSTLAAHLALLSLDDSNEDAEELAATPIFTQSVLEYGTELKAAGKTEPFAQHGLLAGILEDSNATKNPSEAAERDIRLFFNTTAPSSVFICGSQGSGKSHSLGCLLENFLTQSKANVLPRPLTGIVFHYDPFGGSPCEAAYLASAKDISVRVLCAPTNIRDIKVCEKRPRPCIHS